MNRWQRLSVTCLAVAGFALFGTGCKTTDSASPGAASDHPTSEHPSEHPSENPSNDSSEHPSEHPG